jgi:two-component system sensor histidine kinase/response regulator
MKHAILCVDDELDNVEALERLFRKKYQVLKATSGEEALKILAQNPVSVIISDQRMPNMTGVELLSKSIATHPETIRILLTGYTDIHSVIEAINAGQIYRYVTKPWDSVDLENAVDKAVERFEVGAELKLKNEALIVANEDLKTLDKAKSDFMMLVNHELKTPLTAIMSFSDLLKETTLDQDQSKFLSRIQTSTLRLQSLVNDVLEYLSAEARLTPIKKTKLSSSKIESMRPLSYDALLKKNHLSIKFDIEQCSIFADEKLLQNVLARLIENALKFSNSTAEILVQGRVIKNQLEIEISNQCQNIQPEKIRHLLKAFTLNEEAFHHSSGNGLGLSISQSLLKLHESPLHFESIEKCVKVGFKIAKLD